MALLRLMAEMHLMLFIMYCYNSSERKTTSEIRIEPTTTTGLIRLEILKTEDGQSAANLLDDIIEGSIFELEDRKILKCKFYFDQPLILGSR